MHATPPKPRGAALAAFAVIAAFGALGARCWGRDAADASLGASSRSGASSETSTAEAGPLARAPDGRPLVLTFEEDFRRLDGPCGQPARWRSAFGDGGQAGPGDGVGKRTLAGNGEMQVYVDRCFAPGCASPFQARPGGLDIVAVRSASPIEGHPFASGVLTTQPSFSQAYGYFEMRARLPRGKGLWPAFWLLPSDLSWPPEIDVMESVGDPARAYATAHSRGRDLPGVEYALADPDAFHRFAVAWDPRDIVWFVDGREVARKPTPPDANKPMFMLLNLAVGGNWPGAPDAATAFPARFSVDWVRAYRFASTSGGTRP